MSLVSVKKTWRCVVDELECAADGSFHSTLPSYVCFFSLPPVGNNQEADKRSQLIKDGHKVSRRPKRVRIFPEAAS